MGRYPDAGPTSSRRPTKRCPTRGRSKTTRSTGGPGDDRAAELWPTPRGPGADAGGRGASGQFGDALVGGGGLGVEAAGDAAGTGGGGAGLGGEAKGTGH